MWSFLVLGIIPGTDIQINFRAWLLALAVAGLLFVVVRAAIRKLRQGGELAPSISSEAH